MVAFELAHVTPHLLLQMVERDIESAIGVLRFALRRQNRTRIEMGGAVGTIERTFMREHDIRIDAPVEIFPRLPLRASCAPAQAALRRSRSAYLILLLSWPLCTRGRSLHVRARSRGWSSAALFKRRRTICRGPPESQRSISTKPQGPQVPHFSAAAVPQKTGFAWLRDTSRPCAAQCSRHRP